MNGKAVLMGVLLLAAAGLGLKWYYTTGVLASVRFDADYWRAPLSYPGDPECHRGRMVTDLQERVLLRGMTAVEVKRLLGPPDITADDEWRYHLGRCRAESAKPRGSSRFDVLVLSFDAQARLGHVGLTRQ